MQLTRKLIIIMIIVDNFYIVLFSDLHKLIIMMIIVHNFYTVLFSDLHKLTVLYKCLFIFTKCIVQLNPLEK